MSQSNQFEYERFATLNESELSAYMEPFANDPSLPIAPEALLRMCSELPTYDEYHLVYALEVGSDRLPETFACRVPPYLAHDRQCVRLAAAAVLDRLPSAVITQHLVNSVRQALLRCPERDSLTYLKPLKMTSAGDA